MTSISRGEILDSLSLKDSDKEDLFRKAVELRNRTVSDALYLRGLIEFSNICANDCYYCGIRKSNMAVRRYEYGTEDILSCVKAAAEKGMKSIVLQSGERRDTAFIKNVTVLLETIMREYPDMAITLSSGEQSRETYKAFLEAGAARYLLRIETSDKRHYEKLHPTSMSFENRLRCLDDLKELGYQVGSGVMIDSPFQTADNLADDILFFKKIDIDMCGMGPYIPHEQSPLASLPYDKERALDLGLKMIAVLRIAMPDINIASTTALETLSPNGRELGLSAGANVVMPQFSPPETRGDYMLYNNKPLFADDYNLLIDNLRKISQECSMKLILNNPGNPLHFINRKRRTGVLT